MQSLRSHCPIYGAGHVGFAAVYGQRHGHCLPQRHALFAVALNGPAVCWPAHTRQIMLGAADPARGLRLRRTALCVA
jgi:hypothetical protein